MHIGRHGLHAFIRQQQDFVGREGVGQRCVFQLYGFDGHTMLHEGQGQAIKRT